MIIHSKPLHLSALTVPIKNTGVYLNVLYDKLKKKCQNSNLERLLCICNSWSKQHLLSTELYLSSFSCGL